MKRIIVYGLLVGVSLFTFMFIVTCNLIGFDVSQRCQIAQDRYKGDCVEALISYLKDEDNSYQSRNSAIWALGQLGDERALPTLKEIYTGDIPDKEPLNERISQYELKKAINLTSGGFNITKLVRANILFTKKKKIPTYFTSP
ncbi:HEAT repeat domain-containing protein [Patescibacteria group bacterium]